MSTENRHYGYQTFAAGASAPSGLHNIINRTTMNRFTFTGYPNNNIGGVPKYVADENNRISSGGWTNYGYQTIQDSNQFASLEVDCLEQYRVTHFAVSGYPNGSHKPTSNWNLQGSNDNSSWTTVGTAHPDQWSPAVSGTNILRQSYPFEPYQIVQCSAPGDYRYYRVCATGWTNNYLLIFNLGLFVGGNMVDTFNRPMVGQIEAYAANAGTIASNNGGYVQFGERNKNGDTSWFSYGGGTNGGATSGITIQRPGIVTLNFNQDIITPGNSGYISSYITKNGTNKAFQLITNTNGQWDAICNSFSDHFSKGDTIEVHYAGGTISSMDSTTWGNYTFMWYNCTD